MRRLTGLAAVALSTAFAFGPLMATPASAAPDAASSCPANRFCMYYNSNFTGSHNEMTSSTLSLEAYQFTSAGAGQGQIIADNAASAVNNLPYTVVVFQEENYNGNGESFVPGASRNLSVCYNHINSVGVAK